MSTTMYYSFIGVASKNGKSRLLNEADGHVYVIDNSIIDRNFTLLNILKRKRFL